MDEGGREGEADHGDQVAMLADELLKQSPGQSLAEAVKTRGGDSIVGRLNL